MKNNSKTLLENGLATWEGKELNSEETLLAQDFVGSNSAQGRKSLWLSCFVFAK